MIKENLMDYSTIYKKLCNRGKLRSKKRGDGLEKHHITPVFFFKDNKRKLRYNDGIFDGDGNHIDNITLLTAREHFIAHLLLCKIFKNTKWEYRCYLSVKMFLNGGTINAARSVFSQSSRKIERYKNQTNSRISLYKKNTIPVKDEKTGKSMGIASLDHPNVVSGKWVHTSKGMKLPKHRIEHLRNISSGYKNGNSKYADDELLNSYKKCCYEYKALVTHKLWVEYSLRNKLPCLKYMKKFRFSNKGFEGMKEKMLSIAKSENVEIEIINPNSHQWRNFVKKEKKKWALE